MLEFGIHRKAKVWEERRARSIVTLIDQKGPSFIPLPETALSGTVNSKELRKLKNDINRNLPITNLSLIMSDPKFLVSCWSRIRSNIGSNTKAHDSVTMDGINSQWFIKTANSFRDGAFQFKPARRTEIPKPNGKKRPLTMPLVLETKSYRKL